MDKPTCAGYAHIRIRYRGGRTVQHCARYHIVPAVRCLDWVTRKTLVTRAVEFAKQVAR